MKMYCRLVKVQVEPGTLWIKIGESLWATGVRQGNVTMLHTLHRHKMITLIPFELDNECYHATKVPTIRPGNMTKRSTFQPGPHKFSRCKSFWASIQSTWKTVAPLWIKLCSYMPRYKDPWSSWFLEHVPACPIEIWYREFGGLANPVGSLGLPVFKFWTSFWDVLWL